MKVHHSLEKFIRDWPVKVACFCIALFICLYQRNAQFEKITVTVPLSVIYDAMVPVSEVPAFVNVTVSTNSDSLYKFSADTVSASLYLNNFAEEGTYSVPISVSISPELMNIEPIEIKAKAIGARNNYVKVSLEQKRDVEVDVVPIIAGHPAKGYSVSEVSAMPSTARVVGPRSLVDKMTGVSTARVDVTGAVRNTRVATKLVNTNPLIYIDTNSEVIVTYTILRNYTTRSFDDVRVFPYELAENIEIAGDVPVVSFELSGAEVSLAEYTLTTDAVFIDCSEVKTPGIYELPVEFNLPSDITISEKSADTVNVEFVLATDNVTRSGNQTETNASESAD